jgi:exopolysaccharide biosynthesis polyprenyl glycosylphosphotransferase
MASYSKHHFIKRSNVLGDLAALGISLLLTTALVEEHISGLSLEEILSMRFSLGNVLGGAFLSAIWLQVLKYFGSYKLQPPSFNILGDLMEIAKATGVGTLIFAAFGLLFRISLFSPMFMLVFWLMVTVLDLAFRQILTRLLNQLHLGDKNQRNVLVVGSNQIAVDYAKMIESNLRLGYQFLGFLDDQVMIPSVRERLVGSLESFPELLKRHVIDEVVITMPIHSCSKAIQDIIDYAHERGISVRFPLSQVFGGISRSSINRVRQEASLGMGNNPNALTDLVVYSGHSLGAGYLIKCIFDMMTALFMIILASPIMITAAALVAMTSGRPVLFFQDRYGYNGRVFKLWKFRTMVKNAEALQAKLMAQNERDGAAFKMKNDPRITPVGRFLRKTSIDELPQLFNVLKGDMSLVGPRPLPLTDYERFTTLGHHRRLSVLPGITGSWQISGRDSITFEEWMRMDLDYIDNWSLLLDFKIMLKTIPIVLFGRGSV